MSFIDELVYEYERGGGVIVGRIEESSRGTVIEILDPNGMSVSYFEDMAYDAAEFLGVDLRPHIKWDVLSGEVLEVVIR
jgi:hypothetical protein